MRQITARAIIKGILTFGLCLAHPAWGAMIYTNLGSGGTYSGNGGWTVSGSSSFVGLQNSAVGFSVTGAGSLTEIELGLMNYQGKGASTAVVSLWTAAAGLPQTEVESWAVTPQAVWPGSPSMSGLTTISDITGVTLNAGASYILEVSPGASDTWDVWGGNDIGVSSAYAYDALIHGDIINIGASGSADTPSLQLVGTASVVPLPATAWLLLSGLCGFGVLTRKRLAV